MTARLPDGFVVELDPGVRRLDGGTVLFGGSPPRLLRLATAAVTLLGTALLGTALPGTARSDTVRLRVTDGRSAALARTLLDAGVAHPRPVGSRPGPAGTPRRPEVTVVIPVRDNPGGLAHLLAALAPVGCSSADDATVCPVVVVDDGSRPPVQAVDGVVLLRHDEPRGPAAARNTGLAAATTPLVAFLDSDVVPVADWLGPLLGHFDDPACALVAPRIVGVERDGNWITRYESVRSSLDLGVAPAPVVPRSRVAYVPSAAVVVRRDALGGGAGKDGVAGFDETMTVAEDVDLCWRLHDRGWSLRYEPRSRVAHAHRSSGGAWLRRKTFYGTGAAALDRRHPGQVPPLALARWMVAACLLAATGRRAGVGAAVSVTMWAGARLVRRLPVRRPVRLGAELVARGVLGAAGQLASAAWRHWWPVAVVIALVSRRARRVILAAGVAEGIADWVRHPDDEGRRPLDPVRHVVAKRLDDLAYGTGLWVGAWRHRSTAALRPHLHE